MMARPMKASGVDWIGDVPAHWELRRHKQIFNKTKTRAVSNLPAGSLSYGEVIFKDEKTLTEETKATYQNVKNGQFLLNPINLNFDLVSLRIGLSKIDVCVSSAYLVFSNFHGEASYLKHALRMFDICYMKTLGAGVRQTLRYDEFAKSLMAYPPLMEQAAIASYLDARTTAIDSKIQLLEEKSKGLAELRKSVVHQAVTKGLDPNVMMKPSGVDWIGDVPAHWSLTRADRLFMKMKKTQQEKNVLSLSYGQVINKKIGNEGLTPETYDTYQGVSPNDIILRLTDLQNDERSIRVAHAFLTGIISSAYLVLKTKDSLLSLFGYSLLHAAGDINKIFYSMGGGVRQTMKFNDIARLSFAVPSIEEQSAIIKYINDRTAIIDESIKTIAKQITALKALRESLIHEAITGKIDVADYGYHYA